MEHPALPAQTIVTASDLSFALQVTTDGSLKIERRFPGVDPESIELTEDEASIVAAVLPHAKATTEIKGPTTSISIYTAPGKMRCLKYRYLDEREVMSVMSETDAAKLASAIAGMGPAIRELNQAFNENMGF
jgi:hypothetical protein